MMKQTYTTNEVAVMLQTELRNVQNYCKRHKVSKRGRDYDISEQDIEGMRDELGKPGRKSMKERQGNANNTL